MECSWEWQMRREVRQVIGRGNYILSSDRENFTNTGVGEAMIHTYHRMVLVVLRGEGALQNRR